MPIPSFLSNSLISFFFFFFNDTATTEIYTVSDTLSLRDALPIWPDFPSVRTGRTFDWPEVWRAWRSEEHTSELQSPDTISYAVFCWKKKKEKRGSRAGGVVRCRSVGCEWGVGG